MTTTEEVRKDIDANWEGVYAALQTVIRLEKRVIKIEADVEKILAIVSKGQDSVAGQPVVVGRKEPGFSNY